MRFILALTLACLLSACDRPQTEENWAAPSGSSAQGSGLTVYAGTGRDRLCVNPETRRVGLITYGESETNCTVRGTIDGADVIRPDGDRACAIRFNQEESTFALLDGGEACGYYCGPGASFANKTFRQTSDPQPVTDLAGDPLC